MTTMRAVEVQVQNGPLVMVERPIPEPAAHEVRVRIQACGVCHSDSITVGGLMGNTYPRVPGHEVIGLIDALGSDTPGWSVGTRVGVGWHSGYCGYCDPCRHGDTFVCATMPGATGVSRDGGYADYLVAHASALARVPDDLASVDAAPLLCAGITTFNAIRNAGARPGDLMAILGIGGLGHLAVQFAAKSGFRTVAVGRGADKEALARQLGAHHYIDSAATDPAAALRALGGAKTIIATATTAEAMAAVEDGLAPNGTMLILGAVGPFPVHSLDLLNKRAAVKGWNSGTSIDSEDTLKFSALQGVASMNEVYPLDQAQSAYDRMMSGKARFRVVLKVGD